MKIYTRTGDDGTTSLSDGRRVPKFYIRVEAYGSVDELISWIGMLRSCPENDKRRTFLIQIQNNLMLCAAVLSSGTNISKGRKIDPDKDWIRLLEKEIDKMEQSLPPLKGFILPGGNQIVSYCHIARCVCRRAERRVLKLNETEKIPEIIYKYLNRLSDYLFILSRKLSFELDNEDIKWII
ncbi:MAG: cob(I)yrinic acid a,c-diamide adenosyltransferase [Bacteroidales bacterium]